VENTLSPASYHGTLRGDVLITAFAELPEPRPDTTHVDEALTNVLQNCEGMRKF